MHFIKDRPAPIPSLWIHQSVKTIGNSRSSVSLLQSCHRVFMVFMQHCQYHFYSSRNMDQIKLNFVTEHLFFVLLYAWKLHACMCTKMQKLIQILSLERKTFLGIRKGTELKNRIIVIIFKRPEKKNVFLHISELLRQEQNFFHGSLLPSQCLLAYTHDS